MAQVIQRSKNDYLTQFSFIYIVPIQINSCLRGHIVRGDNVKTLKY